ncbi:MAG: toprim domain-containing protein [Planctomycetota bacterium]
MDSKKVERVSYPVKSIKAVIEELKELPGVGPRLAERIVDYIIEQGIPYIEKFANLFYELSRKMKLCSMCFGYSEQQLCSICTDSKKVKNILCIVQYPRDILKIESLNEYNGLYYVLGNVEPERIENAERIKILHERIRRNNIREVILALGTDFESSFIATYIVEKLLLPNKVKVSQLAIGVPYGYPLEFVDTNTLTFAFRAKKYIN